MTVLTEAVAAGTSARRDGVGEVDPAEVGRVRRTVWVEAVAGAVATGGRGEAVGRAVERGRSSTYAEVRNQPRAWRATAEAVERWWPTIDADLAIGPAVQALFCGSGTSLYIAQAAAAVFQEATGLPARAVPTSEVFLSPGTTVPRSGPVVAFVISRSGTTSEAVIAADFLRQNAPWVRTVAVTCKADTELAAVAEHALELPFAEEQSVVMTQSFTSMLLALQLIAAAVGEDAALLGDLARLPDVLEERLDGFEAFGRALGERQALARFVFLGLGPNAGLAEEGTLKLKEMTQVPCEAYNPLEFRHGPISVVADDTAAVLLAGDRERAYLDDLAADLKGAGAEVAVVGPDPVAHADRFLPLPGGLSDLARGPLYLPPLQFLAYHRALALGLDPDQPRNLSQVVLLGAR